MATFKKKSTLIVDFPVCMMASLKSVRFAHHNEGIYFRRPTNEDNVAKSFHEEDYDHFKNILVRDVVKCSAKLAADTSALHDKKTSDKHFVRCVGIDHLIPRDVQQCFHDWKQSRKNHVCFVLNLQKWQRANMTQGVGWILLMYQRPVLKRLGRELAVVSASIQ